jgi:hypothetical protein
MQSRKAVPRARADSLIFFKVVLLLPTRSGLPQTAATRMIPLNRFVHNPARTPA